MGGHLLKSKFVSFCTKSINDDYKGKQAGYKLGLDKVREEDSDDELSASVVPDSIEVRSIKSIGSGNKGRTFKWLWNQSRGTMRHKSHAKGHVETDGYPEPGSVVNKSTKMEIRGNEVVLFGETLKIDRTGQEPEDGDEELIYSEEHSVPPYSFYDWNNKYDKKAPPPVYFRFEDLTKPKPTDKDEILQAFKINNNGYLECTDEKIIEGNKGVIPYVLKQMAKNVLSGKSIVAISLPVRIFQQKSLLERILDACSFVPTYCSKACKATNELDRMKYLICLIVAGMFVSADLRKPFNPILGETLEGYFKDGTRIYMEHTSHHPPISSYLIEGPKEYAFKMYGAVEFKANIKNAGNILDIFFEGATHVEFPDGHVIEFHYPTTKVSGLMWGDRTVNIEGTGILIDHKYDQRGIIVFNPKVPRFDNTDEPTSFEGLIYKSKSKVRQKKKIESLSDVTDIESEICELYGNTLKEVIIDDEQYWDINDHKPYRFFPNPTVLPSDSRFREDLIWLVYENHEYSQEWKSKLEVQQRYDKKLRLACETKRKKKKQKFIME